MFVSLRPRAVALLLLASGSVSAVEPVSLQLSLVEAERRALDADAGIRAAQATAQALREQAVAAGQLPDPTVSLGVMNLPADSFDRREVDMTQLSVGVSQAFPPGATLQHRSARTGHLAAAAEAGTQARRHELLRETRLAYLELAYQDAAVQLIAATRSQFDDLLAVTEAQYRTGRNSLQDVLSAQLEYALLGDRLAAAQSERDAARADLERWAGPLGPGMSLPAAFPALAAPPAVEALQAGLETHPRIAAAQARVAAGQSAVEIARQQYKPGWMLDLSYGERSGHGMNGARRSDLLSAMVTLDLPLFTGKRQDRRVAAGVAETEALRYTRDDVYRELQRALAADYPRWRQLQRRERDYTDSIVPVAHHNAAAALTAYRNGVSDFTALIRARLADLDSRLQALRTRTERLQTQARLLYLAGEDA
ncbi:MAG: TolC family protein [Gammaproteobacteria bacterium]